MMIDISSESYKAMYFKSWGKKKTSEAHKVKMEFVIKMGVYGEKQKDVIAVKTIWSVSMYN